MSKSLLERFQDAVKDVERPHPNYFQHAMPDIRRAMGPINDDQSFFDPDLIRAHGIDPEKWLATYALGFAKKTLAITGYNTHPAHGEVAYVRCHICLNEHGRDAFGPVLPDDIKEQLQAKLIAMEPFKPAANHSGADVVRKILGRDL